MGTEAVHVLVPIGEPAAIEFLGAVGLLVVLTELPFLTVFLIDLGLPVVQQLGNALDAGRASPGESALQQEVLDVVHGLDVHHAAEGDLHLVAGSLDGEVDLVGAVGDGFLDLLVEGLGSSLDSKHCSYLHFRL